MKRKAAELKCIARGNLTRHYGVPMGAMVVSELIQTVPLLFFSMNLTIYSGVKDWVIYYVAAFVVALIGVILAMGNSWIALHMCRREEYHFKDLFHGFVHHPDKYILATLLMTLIIMVPMLPGMAIMIVAAITDNLIMLIVASVVLIAGYVFAIIWMLGYSLTMILLLDNKCIGIIDALKESKRLMKGNKGRMFYIGLSFIGWILLGMLSLGIGLLWIMPYMTQTQTVFYLDVIGELDNPVSPQTNPYQQQQNAYQNMWN